MKKLKTLLGIMRSAAHERFVLPHYHCYIRFDRGAEKRVIMPQCALDPEFIGDPFLFRKDGTNWLFFEGLYARRGNRGRSKGVIGCLKQDGDSWHYCGIALEESWHLSFPQIFEEAGHIYMIPESGQSGAVSLYECVDFPLRWIKRRDLIVGNCNYVDAALVHEGEAYYMVVTPARAPANPELWLSDSLLGPWKKHPQSDHVSGTLSLRRNGGAFIREKSRLYRIAQDCDGGYGIRMFRVPIVKLSREAYEEGSAEELSSAINWPQPLPHHTYNRISCGDSILEVVDRHFYTRKTGWQFFATLFWFLTDSLLWIIRGGHVPLSSRMTLSRKYHRTGRQRAHDEDESPL